MNLLILGAHPDDADYSAGGVASLYRKSGHRVRMISLTNGDAGHHSISGPDLANRRKQEAAQSGKIIGAAYDVLSYHDGELLPTLEARREIIQLIRQENPDLILTHRPNDYHPDHRYTSQLIQDAAYMVTVPPVVPGTRHLNRNPVIAYMPDDFQKPYPFSPTVAIDVGPVVESIVDMLDCHQSQFYEWLPFNQGILDQVPATQNERRTWLGNQIRERLRKQADRFRPLLCKLYGNERGSQIEFAEGFEGCEYGAPMNEEVCRKLFPFIPW